MDLTSAVINREIVAFTYDGLERVVQPATYGVTTTQKLTLRGCQVGGQTRRNTTPCWELYTESKMVGATASGQTFDHFAVTGYTRGDSAFVRIIAEY